MIPSNKDDNDFIGIILNFSTQRAIDQARIFYNVISSLISNRYFVRFYVRFRCILTDYKRSYKYAVTLLILRYVS